MISYGFPERTYFEIFAGKHPSRKIYSVQVAEWIKYFSKPIFRYGHQPGDKVELDYAPTAAVVQLSQQKQQLREDHFLVEPTADLVDFLKARGVTIPDQIYVQPRAFSWDEDVVEEYGSTPSYNGNKPTKEQTAESTSMKRKSLLAALIAVIAFLK